MRNDSDHNVGSEDSQEFIRKMHINNKQYKKEGRAWTDTTQKAMNEI